MRIILIFLLLISNFQIFGQTTLDKTININGSLRYYRIYIPEIYNQSNQVPLVFNFHGYTSNSIEQENYGDFRAIADTANFILVHPQGLDGGSGTFWNNFGTTDMSNFDYQFISQLINSLVIDYAIDESRIYSTGMSNGGFMSYDLACFMSHRFAAIASVTGSMISSHLSACNPVRRIPVMQIHGTNDLTVSYDGENGIISSVPIDDLISFWVLNNDCNSNPNFTNLPDINTSDNSTVEHFLYQGINTSVELYKVINGGHTWPGTIFTSSATNQDFSASKEIWRFFSQYNLNQETSSLVKNQKNNISLFPNPAIDEVKISSSLNEIGDILIYDQFGRLIYSNNVRENNLSIQTENFEDGLYFLILNGEKIKFLIQNNN
jgi:polyhydroxybutyrate depolymerase